MLKNYFITAWRNLVRSKVFSIINIGGLSIGIGTCILIFLFVQDELSYDTHWKNGDRIVKINWEESTDGVPNPYSGTPYVGGPSWKENLPEIETFTRLLLRNNQTISYDGKYFNEDNNFLVDTNFLSVLDFELSAGDPKTCLSEASSVIVSEALAKKFFGNENPMGKVLQYPKGPYKITGVLKNTLKKSHLKPTSLLRINYDNEQIQYKNAMTWLQTYTYIKLKRASDVAGFDDKLKQWTTSILEPMLKESNIGYGVTLKSELISEVHFDNYFKDSFEKADKNYVLIFALVAIFLLLIACFNFVNLSTARASKRLKEVGVRKASGANRKQLILQFLGESFLISFIALLTGMLLLFLLIPAFNGFTGKNIQLATLFATKGFWTLLSILVFISVAGGIYPALYLSGFNPVNILKGNIIQHKKINFLSRFSLRQLLVVSQFTISGTVIICTIMVYHQLKMMKNKDLGFNKEQVLVVKFPRLDSLKAISAMAFKNKISTQNSVKGVSTCRQLFGASGNTLFRVKGNGKADQASLNIGVIDASYIDLLGIKLLQGRNFSKEPGRDQEAYIINESALKLMGLKDPLSVELCSDDVTFGKIVGVVKDYNYYSPHIKIEPMAFKFGELGSLAFVKLSPQNITTSIDQISREWKEFFPFNPINYYFLDEKFNEEFYRNEDIMLVLLSCFSALTILISCLGLFGLASFVTEQRTKEIAIRKVVGASVSNILFHISKDFISLVLAATLLSSPIAFYFSHRWLQNFAYRVNIEPWLFLITGFLTIVIAFMTMSFRTISAANANPVKSLRTD
ncbi:MAG TPA: ABC transporter permease [Bacteroidia bacterium]|nr:ABC transporter permease [Bacteroidia bacterium]